MKNLTEAIKNQKENEFNYFDSNYTIDQLLHYEKNKFDKDNTDKLNTQLVVELYRLARPICNTLLNFSHFSDLMDAEEEDQKVFFKKFELKEQQYSSQELENNFNNEDGKNAMRIALAKEYNKLDQAVLAEKNVIDALKEIQFIIVKQKNIVIDTMTLLQEIKNSTVLMKYMAFVATKSLW